MAKATGFIEHNRKDRQYIDVKQRLKNFKEFTKPLNKNELKIKHLGVWIVVSHTVTLVVL